MLADGLFHVLASLFTIAGVVLLWRAWGRSPLVAPGRTMAGSVLLGWGLFNLVEGVLSHHLLAIHHVWPAGPGSVLLWDQAYLAWGAVMVVAGLVLVRQSPAGNSRGRPAP